MNTPAHVILNAVVLGRGESGGRWLPVTAGALAPDLPMYAFYVFQRAVLGRPERMIWSEAYFDPAWQALFNGFNSLPIVALGCAVAWRLKRPGWLAFFMSMGLHCLADLPLHNDDGHAHLFPLTDWRFRSPVSYWDPRHYGQWFAILETLLVLAGSLALILRKRFRAWRVIGAATLLLYAAFWAFALTVGVF